MKKLILLLLMACTSMATSLPSEAQNKSHVVSRTYVGANGGWHFKMDTVIGKGLTMIQLFDSVQNKWLNPNSSVIVDSLTVDTISNAKDAAFFQTLIYHQKASGNTLGLIDKTWYYVWQGSGRLYYKARYTKMLVIYKGS